MLDYIKKLLKIFQKPKEKPINKPIIITRTKPKPKYKPRHPGLHKISKRRKATYYERRAGFNWNKKPEDLDI